MFIVLSLRSIFDALAIIFLVIVDAQFNDNMIFMGSVVWIW